jgi:hypothetical protein
LSKSNEPIDSIDYIFPLLAAKSLGEANAGARIEAALQALKKAAPDESRPASLFAEGALLIAAGKSGDGEALLRKAIDAADPFVQYMSLTALAENSKK